MHCNMFTKYVIIKSLLRNNHIQISAIFVVRASIYLSSSPFTNILAANHISLWAKYSLRISQLNIQAILIVWKDVPCSKICISRFTCRASDSMMYKINKFRTALRNMQIKSMTKRSYL